MKTIFVIAAGLFAATVGALAAAETNPNAYALADMPRETRPLASFSRIEVEGVGELTLRQGKTESVTVEAPAELLPRIRTRVRDKTLYIDVSQDRRWSDLTHLFESQPTPRITVDFVRLEALEAGGAIKLLADGIRADDLRLDFAGASTVRLRNLQAAALHLEGSGATKIEVSGKVGTQDIELSGAGSYAAFDMESERAEVRVSGAGKAYVNAKISLLVEISGAGFVEYMGNPKVDKDISGVGKVRRHDGD